MKIALRKEMRAIQNQWITAGIINSIKHKNKMYKRAIISGSHCTWEKYKKYRNIVTTLVYKAKNCTCHINF